ncbi:kinase-like protein [Aspergillus vadensis CBS 113365]|uniref:non-specific serine/threonine protein kinase n=1 Tax=Aspergillus vadensis (strain CBS 113365 / IMI 142717 / IBT 24658) TaxID=1448311 RepID=A0A319BD25_ASPVC|nr:kinase-like protein [Aspergillus vadensis CBS 113365]PYH70577.1 kinase-like protein [Aspergillus vadensis CBS 113365]
MTLFRHTINKPLRSMYYKPSKPLSLKSTPPTYPLEEERNPHYNPQKYYPARIGETIGNRYRIISKLGWGANSTAWLAKDISRWPWQPTKYVTLKITNCGEGERKAAEDELELSQHISGLRSEHEGCGYVRLVEDSFEVQGILGDHLCLVFEPLREPLWVLGRHLGSTNGVPPQVLKAFLRVILTDLKADNFLIGFEDVTILDQYAHQQEAHPAPHVLRNGRPIYESRNDFGPLKRGVGLLRISDFSAAVFGDVSTPHNHDIQPQPFSAPEVLLKAGWSYSADIWNLGTVLWELLADETLFDGLCEHRREYSRERHIAQMIRLLGLPPSRFLDKCDPCIRDGLFSGQGTFKFPELIPSEEFNFSNMTPFLCGEDKRLFIEFVRRMLQWEPENRSSAKELYNDPWLCYEL